MSEFTKKKRKVSLRKVKSALETRSQPRFSKPFLNFAGWFLLFPGRSLAFGKESTKRRKGLWNYNLMTVDRLSNISCLRYGRI